MNSIREKTSPFILIACAASLFTAFGAHASVPVERDPRIPTPGELTLLPPYCPHTQIISTRYGRKQSPSRHDAQTKPFVDLYGKDFWHLHHYCFGLTRALRAERLASREKREQGLELSIGEYQYVMRNVGPNSIILPELHMQKGISLIKLKRGAEAVLELKKAIQLNPRFVRPYIELSNYYADSGEKELALQTLEDGLKVSPDTAGLQRRYAELGGTKTFSKAEVPQQETQEALQPEQAVQENEAPRAEEQIGSPTNPYCRFCP
jgi:tetratricopeptide (TPR) repeat protein